MFKNVFTFYLLFLELKSKLKLIQSLLKIETCDELDKYK